MARGLRRTGSGVPPRGRRHDRGELIGQRCGRRRQTCQFRPLRSRDRPVGKDVVADVLCLVAGHDRCRRLVLGGGETPQGRRLSVAGMADVVAGVDQLGSQSCDLVGQLLHVGAQPVDDLVAAGDLVGEDDDLGPRSCRHLLGCVTALLGLLELAGDVGRLTGSVRLGREPLDLTLPAVGTLQPDLADRIDELGKGARGDAGAERVVLFDHPTDRGQRAASGSDRPGSTS